MVRDAMAAPSRAQIVSVVIPALHEGENLALLLPALSRAREQAKTLKSRYSSIVLYGYGTIGRLLAPIFGDSLSAIVDQSADGDNGHNPVGPAFRSA